MFGMASYVLGTAAGLVYGPTTSSNPNQPHSTISSTTTTSNKKSRNSKRSSRHSNHHRGPSTSTTSNLNVKETCRENHPRKSNLQNKNRTSTTQIPPPLNQSHRINSNHSSKLRPNGEHGLAFDLVDQINRDQDLYHVLGFKDYNFYNRHQIKFEDIRKSYITRSRLCHPDKLPLYPSCTPAFQKLSFAYETLSKPTTRRLYDLNGGNYHDSLNGNQFSFDSNNSSSRNGSGSSERFKAYRASGNNDPSNGPSNTHSADETLNGVLHSTFCEFMDGDFEMIRVLINALNEGNPGLNLGEEAINNLETSFKKLRTILLTGQKYIKLIRFELFKLYELQTDLRSLSYFNLLGRLRITLALARVTVSIPMRIDEAMREEEDGNQIKSGLLPRGVTGLLEATVAVLERGERATMWASSQTHQSENDPPTTTFESNQSSESSSNFNHQDQSSRPSHSRRQSRANKENLSSI
ncbi:hypothetical protein CROQUDRAFT_72282 [Cronartium quercuum f. sp. fusiforme G11]|uniref:J domain-containing protein n=1 Tax=Cronartium quercuum f. sp. fusiforme G11 TaxID=708437 RepID=A0A9P6NX33_9BASI|nr:hypothetical protein CROQUDRAFT_72282 [Cronartium quercuum f. sp. fusiforme G11]